MATNAPAKQTLAPKTLRLMKEVPGRKAISLSMMNKPIVGKVKGCR